MRQGVVYLFSMCFYYNTYNTSTRRAWDLIMNMTTHQLCFAKLMVLCYQIIIIIIVIYMYINENEMRYTCTHIYIFKQKCKTPEMSVTNASLIYLSRRCNRWCTINFSTNAGILLIWLLGTNSSEMLIEIDAFSFKKTHLKMSSGKWRPSCLGLNVFWCFVNVWVGYLTSLSSHSY